MLVLIGLTNEEIAQSNDRFEQTVVTDAIKQMKLSNNGEEIDFSLEKYEEALDFSLGE